MHTSQLVRAAPSSALAARQISSPAQPISGQQAGGGSTGVGSTATPGRGENTKRGKGISQVIPSEAVTGSLGTCRVTGQRSRAGGSIMTSTVQAVCAWHSRWLPASRCHFVSRGAESCLMRSVCPDRVYGALHCTERLQKIGSTTRCKVQGSLGCPAPCRLRHRHVHACAGCSASVPQCR